MLRLEPMTPEEFDRFIGTLKQHYAAEHVRAGTWSAEDSLFRAGAEISALLPTGVSTPDHYFRRAIDTSGMHVGDLWFAVQREGGQPTLWIFWIGVDASHRRHGAGQEMLAWVDAEARRLGARNIGLHVFADNAAARALYEKAGYIARSVILRKDVEPRADLPAGIRGPTDTT